MSLVDELLKTDCVKFGEFKLKSGEISKYYFDIKGLISYPDIMASIGDKIYNDFIKNYPCDLLCGVPMGGLPLCSYISVSKKIPMIMVRDSVKDYGTNKQIEGKYHKKNKCIIIEDVINLRDSILKYEAIKPDGTPDLSWTLNVNDQAGFGMRRYTFEGDSAELAAMWKCCISRQIDLNRSKNTDSDTPKTSNPELDSVSYSNFTIFNKYQIEDGSRPDTSILGGTSLHGHGGDLHLSSGYGTEPGNLQIGRAHV